MVTGIHLAAQFHRHPPLAQKIGLARKQNTTKEQLTVYAGYKYNCAYQDCVYLKFYKVKCSK